MLKILFLGDVVASFVAGAVVIVSARDLHRHIDAGDLPRRWQYGVLLSVFNRGAKHRRAIIRRFAPAYVWSTQASQIFLLLAPVLLVLMLLCKL